MVSAGKKKVCLVLLVMTLFLLTSSALADAPIGFNTDFLVDYSSQVVFVDVMKQSRDWVDQNWAPAGALQRRSDGYPTEIPQGSITMVRTLFNTAGDSQPFPHLLPGNPTRSSQLIAPPGDYTVFYDGTGTLQFSGSAQIMSPCASTVGSANNQYADYRCVINMNEGGIITMTQSDVSDPIRNIRILMPGYAAAQADEFYPPFINKLGGTSTIRFMNAMNTNRGSGRNPNEPPITWNDRTRANHNTQSTRAGMSVEQMVRISNQARKSPWFTISHLATADPNTNDPNDYVRNFARHVANNLDPTLNVYVEFSNELWNTIFGQSVDITQQACDPNSPAFVPFPGGGTDWGIQGCDDLPAMARLQGIRSGEIFTIFQQEFTAAGADINRIVRIIASQSGSVGWERFRFDPIFYGLNLVGQTADGVAVAPYFGGGVPGTFRTLDQIQATTVDQLLDLVDQDIDTAVLGSIQGIAQYAAERGVDFYAYEGGHHLTAAGVSVQLTTAQRCDLLVYQRTLDFCSRSSVLCTDPCATGYGLTCDATQVGCWDPTGLDANGNYITSGENALPFFPAKLIAASHHPRMQGMYERYLDMWFNNGGNVFNIYKYVNEPGKWGSWGTLDYLTQPLSEAPMYAGVMSSVTKYDGFVPPPPPPPTPGFCGDGTIDAGEQCDDGNNNNGDGCSATCQIEQVGICGDGTVDVGEQCDDGNLVNGDGCDSVCQIEAQPPANTNGLIFYWDFEPGMIDQSGNRNHPIIDTRGSLLDPASCTVAGFQGNGCLVGNTLDNEFIYTSTPLQPDEPNGFTSALWVNFQTAGSKNNLFAVSNEFYLRYDSSISRLTCALNSGGIYRQAITTYSPQLNSWDHLACSFDPTTSSLYLYINGVEVSRGDATGFRSFSTGIGNSFTGVACGNYYFCPAGGADVVYDNVYLYNRALSASEIDDIFSGRNTNVCGNGIVEGSEECDDGNIFNNDGCSATCQNEQNNGGTTVIIGDISGTQSGTGDGVDSNDVVLVVNHILRANILATSVQAAADTTCDGQIDIRDVILTYRSILGLTNLPTSCP